MTENDDIITLFDEDGIETDFIIVDGIDYEEKAYLALVEAAHADDDECEFIILRVETDENEEEVLVTIEDEEEFNNVMQVFNEAMDEDDEFGVDIVDSDVEE